MDIFSAIIQGAVQGLTEFLPVSSSGHLALSQHILGVKENNLFFDVMLHIGTLIAVVAFYYKKILSLIKAFFQIIADIIKGKFKPSRLHGDQNTVAMLIVGLVPLFLLFLPTASGHKNIKGFAEELSGANNIAIVGLFLVITSIFLKLGIKIEHRIKEKDIRLHKKNKRNFIRVYDALYIGLAQFFAAVFPGLSRSGSTLAAGLMRGINKQTALDYSFILGIPAVVAAAVLELKESVETGAINDINMFPVIIGMIVSAVVGFMAIKVFKWLLKTDKMKIFVIYTAVVGVISIAIGLIEIINGVNIFTGVPL